MPTAINNNIATIHKKEWQQMNPLITNSNAGSCMIADPRGVYDYSLMVFSTTVQALYFHSQDHYVTIPSMAMSSIAGGSNGCMARWSGFITANGGTTTTITTASPINTLCIGRIVRFATGTAGNIGLQRTVTNLVLNPTGTSTITLDSALPSAVANADTFRIDTGMFYMMGAGAAASGIFKSYDPLTGITATLGFSGLPTVGTDSFILNTTSFDIYATGTATAGAASTITNSIKTWTVNQWANYQIRITAGTGIGQVRTIASNTATVITTSAAWTTTPDVTSVYEIAGDDNNIYFGGNGAVTLYKYSISANTWATITPTSARGGVTNVGCTGVWNYKTGNADWANESNILDGKYIYSYRGNVISTTLDRYDIAANTWVTLTLPGSAEVASPNMFSLTSSVINNDTMITRLGNTHRYMAYNICTGVSYGLSQNIVTDGANFSGVRMWLKKYQESGVDKLIWIYSWRGNSAELYRLLLY